MEEISFDWTADDFVWPYGTYLTQIPTLEAARRALGPVSQTVRQARSRLYWRDGEIRNRGRLRLGMHDRGEEYVFANGNLHGDDRHGQSVHLPLHVKVLRLKTLRLGPGEVYDITSSHTYWPRLHYREELYVYMHVDRLVVAPGAVLQVRGNVLVLTCDEAVADAPASFPEASLLDVRILGTDHPAFSQFRRAPAEPGRVGQNGDPGRSVAPPRPRPSIFGPIHPPSPTNEAATDGGDGAAGADGTHGQNGGMCMLAAIHLGKLTGFPPGGLCIFGQAGAGRPGASGGDGGAGGNGGSAPQAPGRGGHGGDGGTGGHGGNGGLSGHIFVEVPTDATAAVTTIAQDSLGGAPGYGGQGGHPGGGGHRLLLDGTTSADLEPASDGPPGHRGLDGRPGRGRKGPRIHILTPAEKPVHQIS
ncbi:hypothetical protein [Halomonas llamarensis]|uniref:hypothetical protein n=1 Tax=Halomonas llamarensis TaxID=2945104 RepID=UPI0024C25A5E|nr:hypothetical protein [Halomonas llamarensis]